MVLEWLASLGTVNVLQSRQYVTVPNCNRRGVRHEGLIPTRKVKILTICKNNHFRCRRTTACTSFHRAWRVWVWVVLWDHHHRPNADRPSLWWRYTRGRYRRKARRTTSRSPRRPPTTNPHMPRLMITRRNRSKSTMNTSQFFYEYYDQQSATLFWSESTNESVHFYDLPFY